MVTITVKEAIECPPGLLDRVADHYLYAYRDGEVVFYVGRSQSPLDRLTEHLGLAGSSGGSRLGNLILDHTPESLAWQMELYTFADCAPLVQQFMPAMSVWYEAKRAIKPGYDKDMADLAEQALIESLRPCLNSINRANYSNPLPQKYIKRRYANEGVKITE